MFYNYIHNNRVLMCSFSFILCGTYLTIQHRLRPSYAPSVPLAQYHVKRSSSDHDTSHEDNICYLSILESRLWCSVVYISRLCLNAVVESKGMLLCACHIHCKCNIEFGCLKNNIVGCRCFEGPPESRISCLKSYRIQRVLQNRERISET